MKRFGYDILPVLVGVLLALIINNYQQSIKDRRFTKQILRTIIEENNQNIANIEELLVKQKRTVDTFNYYAEWEDLSNFDLVRKVQGLSTPDLVDNGINFLFNANQTLVEMDILLKLAEISEEMGNYSSGSNTLSEIFYQDLFETSEESKRRVSLILQDVMNYERNIVKLSKEFNEMYNSR